MLPPNPKRCCRLLGHFTYLTVTRLELHQLVQQLMQWSRDIGMQHYKYNHYLGLSSAVKTQYWKTMSSQGMSFLKPSSFVVISELLWHIGRCPTTCQYVTGYLIMLRGILISCKIKKQWFISRLYAKVEDHF